MISTPIKKNLLNLKVLTRLVLLWFSTILIGQVNAQTEPDPIGQIVSSQPVANVVSAQTIVIAVAANFYDTLAELKRQFELVSPHRITIVSGSTGKLYAQILNGAPFDAFFAADKQRPMLLEQNSVALKGSRFTYAYGRLVLWSPVIGRVDQKGAILGAKNIRHIAMANPKLAPYGVAAQEYLQSQQLTHLNHKLVRGENIAQAFHLVASGSAELGFVGLSQLKNPNRNVTGSYWLVPQQFYQPIEQQAVILKSSLAMQDFIQRLSSQHGQQVIQNFGYHVERPASVKPLNREKNSAHITQY